jgi:hypothetical protein
MKIKVFTVNGPLNFVGNGMSSIALVVSVAFLKQPALPSKAPQTKNETKKITNESKVAQKIYFLFFEGRSARHCIRLFQKSDRNPQC